MRQVTVWETSDGEKHNTYAEAKRHADNRYGNLLTKLSHELCRTEGKYAKAGPFIESALDSFVRLSQLRDDAQMEPSEDDDA